MKLIKCFVIIIYSVLCFSIITTISYNNNINTLKKTSSLFYDKNSLFFTSSSGQIDYNELLDKLPINTLLYSQVVSNLDIRGVMLKGKIEPPQLKSGRFFTKEDYQDSNTRLAVVGSKVNTIVHNGKKFVNFGEEAYEVIGTIGYSMPTKLDMTIMLSMNENILKDDNLKFIINGKNIQENLDFLGNEEIFGQVVIYENTNENILHVIDAGKNQLAASVFFILLLIFNTILLLHFLLENKKNEIIIKKMNGFDNKDIFIDIFKELIKILICGLLAGSIIAFVFSIGRYDINIYSLCVSYGGIAVLSMVCFFLVIKNKVRSINKQKLGVLN
jgi:hypothetical protein